MQHTLACLVMCICDLAYAVHLCHFCSSFGHFEAVQYDLVRGFNSATTSPEDTLKGFCKTRAAVLNVNPILCVCT